ncbi:hypothetical protein M514_20268 [Trichuris suis]|uniref:Uncharacterized protein n=1 Tax=Trichuris suis TaxID=68888 RepID=A0A085NDP5_9BILA|nr:hypothetical protein M514_20268 [Trichuris suis]
MAKRASRVRVSHAKEDLSYAKFRNKVSNRSVHRGHLANSNRVLADTLQKARNEVKRLKMKIDQLKREGVDLKIELMGLNQFTNCFALLEQPEKEAETFKKYTEQLKLALHQSLSKGKEARTALKNLRESYAELEKHLRLAIKP